MMKMLEIADAAGMLGRLLMTGETLSRATEEMAQMQPRHADFWKAASAANQNGRPVSESLALVWPESLVSMVHAGEQAGRLPAVLLSIRDTCDLQLRLRKVTGKLKMPLAILGIAICIGLFFMGFLIPRIVRSIVGSNSRGMPDDPLTRLAFFLESLWKDHAIALVVGLVVVSVALFRWIRSPEGAEAISRTVLTMPVVGQALTDIAFGLWAKYLAVTVSSGIPLIDGLRMTAAVLPAPLRLGVDAMHHDLAARNYSISRAVGDEDLATDDPRHAWPRYIVNAFRVGQRTGLLDAEFDMASPALLDQGERRLTRFIDSVALPACIGIAAMTAITPLILIYQPILRVIGSLH